MNVISGYLEGALQTSYCDLLVLYETKFLKVQVEWAGHVETKNCKATQVKIGRSIKTDLFALRG